MTKPIYGPLSYMIIIGAVTLLAAWGVTDGYLGDDLPECVGHITQEEESAVTGSTGGQGEWL